MPRPHRVWCFSFFAPPSAVGLVSSLRRLPTPDKSPVHLGRPFPLVLAIEIPDNRQTVDNYVDTLGFIMHYCDHVRSGCHC